MRERTCLALIAICAFGMVESLYAADTLPVVTAAVHNHADVPGDVLTKAETEASRIFRHAGVRVRWVVAIGITSRHSAATERTCATFSP